MSVGTKKLKTEKSESNFVHIW